MTPAEQQVKFAEAVKSLGELVALTHRMRANACTLFAHPDATDEQLLDAAKRLGTVVRSSRDAYRQLAAHPLAERGFVTRQRLTRIQGELL